MMMWRLVVKIVLFTPFRLDVRMIITNLRISVWRFLSFHVNNVRVHIPVTALRYSWHGRMLYFSNSFRWLR